MPEGKFCNRRPINTEEDLKALLGDKGGQQYYKEMEMLEVDTVALWETLQKTCKSRTRTWLEICAHCGLCANSCFLYTANNRDPKQVPSYKIQSTLGEMLRPQGTGRHEVHDRYDGSGMGEMYLLQPLRHVLPARHRHGRHVQLSARRAVFSGLRAVGTQDRCGYASAYTAPRWT